MGTRINIIEEGIIRSPNHKMAGKYCAFAEDRFKVGSQYGYGTTQEEANDNALQKLIQSQLEPREHAWRYENIRERVIKCLKTQQEKDIDTPNSEVNFLLQLLELD